MMQQRAHYGGRPAAAHLAKHEKHKFHQKDVAVLEGDWNVTGNVKVGDDVVVMAEEGAIELKSGDRVVKGDLLLSGGTITAFSSEVDESDAEIATSNNVRGNLYITGDIVIK
jgi:hypothetical protein